ncbi:hypothetical protein CVT26_007156 [Gymnopilus dilepis]|uniref:Uncharacterized protein n=1 Tax=Gymnopilus dilepis TaxID=231916 RepID=A0A409W6R2_9AGAR|nr:hypothetical protein CVT26_007156 [Gymnopilus dilepis]
MASKDSSDNLVRQLDGTNFRADEFNLKPIGEEWCNIQSIVVKAAWARTGTVLRNETEQKFNIVEGSDDDQNVIVAVLDRPV